MADYTESLGLELITPGTQAGLWGTTTNNNLTNVDQAISGITPISFAGLGGTTYTLTSNNGAADEARSAVLNISGTATSANTVVIPNKQKLYVVRNDTGQSITFKTAGTGAVYVVQAGYYTMVFCDGDDNVYTGLLVPGATTLGVNGGGTGVTTFTAGFVVSSGGTANLTTQPAVGIGGTATNQIIGQLPVGNGGTGQTTFTSGALLSGNGSGNLGSVVVGTAGQGLVSTGSAWAAANTVNTITQGTGILITGSAGNFTISATGSSSGTVTSVSGTGTVNGLTLTGTVTTAGNLTLGGTLSGTASGLTAGGLTGSPSINVSSVTATGGIVAYSGTSSYSALNSQSISLYNAQSGMFQSGSQFGWQFNNIVMAALLNGGSFYCLTGTYGTLSDQRAKENIVPARNYLADLCKLEVVNYSLKSENSDKPTKLGFIAQQVEQVMPGLVETMPDKNSGIQDYKSIKTSVLVPMLVQAIQDLKAEVDSLKAQIGA